MEERGTQGRLPGGSAPVGDAPTARNDERLWRQGRRGRPVVGERFWSRVGRRGDDECWEWTGPVGPWGYGIGYAAGVGSQRTNRIAWELTYGPIPDGLHVLHRCDNRACCNPAHLYLGTHQENMRDRENRGRTAQGERVGSAKLTVTDVLYVRVRHADGASIGEIARELGRGRTTISKLVRGLTWGGV